MELVLASFYWRDFTTSTVYVQTSTTYFTIYFSDTWFSFKNLIVTKHCAYTLANNKKNTYQGKCNGSEHFIVC